MTEYYVQQYPYLEPVLVPPREVQRRPQPLNVPVHVRHKHIAPHEQATGEEDPLPWVHAHQLVLARERRSEGVVEVSERGVDVGESVQRGEARQEKVEARERHEVGGNLVQIGVQGTLESAGGEGGVVE
jgi:hypothetical protein